jgi:hypothetical protein
VSGIPKAPTLGMLTSHQVLQNQLLQHQYVHLFSIDSLTLGVSQDGILPDLVVKRFGNQGNIKSPRASRVVYVQSNITRSKGNLVSQGRGHLWGQTRDTHTEYVGVRSCILNLRSGFNPYTTSTP